MNRTGKPGRFAADEKRSQVLTGVSGKVIDGPGAIEMVNRDNKISRDNGKDDQKVMDKRIRKSSGPERNWRQ